MCSQKQKPRMTNNQMRTKSSNTRMLESKHTDPRTNRLAKAASTDLNRCSLLARRPLINYNPKGTPGSVYRTDCVLKGIPLIDEDYFTTGYTRRTNQHPRTAKIRYTRDEEHTVDNQERFVFVEVTEIEANTIESYYPGAGEYEMPDKDNKKVTLEVTGEISALIKTAEEEHIHDMERAEYLVLKVGHDVLTDVGHNYPAIIVSSGKKIETIEKLITDNALNTDRSLPGNTMQWPFLYKKLEDMTLERDTKNWHTFNTEVLLEDENKIETRLKEGPNMKIPGPTSNELIKFE